MRFRSLQLLAALAVLFPTSALAQSMNAQSFYQRATALQDKGMMAVFSRGEIKALMAEAQAAMGAARGQRLAAVAAGKPQRYCPTVASGTISTTELMQRLGSIPAADRARIDMTEAMTRVLAAKFPCRA